MTAYAKTTVAIASALFGSGAGLITHGVNMRLAAGQLEASAKADAVQVERTVEHEIDPALDSLLDSPGSEQLDAAPAAAMAPAVAFDEAVYTAPVSFVAVAAATPAPATPVVKHPHTAHPGTPVLVNPSPAVSRLP